MPEARKRKGEWKKQFSKHAIIIDVGDDSDLERIMIMMHV